MSEVKPVVSILMGSRSDLPTMENCFNQLKEFGIPFEAHALSAHRTPNEVIKLAEGAKDLHSFPTRRSSDHRKSVV